MQNPNLKKRPKASPVRLEGTLRNTQCIQNKVLCANTMVHFSQTDTIDLAQTQKNACSVPYTFWAQHKDLIRTKSSHIAVQIAADESETALADIADDLSNTRCIVICIANYQDGRAYSHAVILRKKYHYTGELRAVGDVYLTQLPFLQRVGFDAFELSETLTPEQVDFYLSTAPTYQNACDNKSLIFHQRRTSF